MDDIFESETRSNGDFSGVFEFDGETSYFYLYKTEGVDGNKIIDSILIFSGTPDFQETDIVIRWDAKEQKVGLGIRGVLWAVFDIDQHSKHGGNYRIGTTPSLPLGVDDGF